MAARITLQWGAKQSGPRPMIPMRDLSAVADLMEVVFASELDATGRQMIREARAIGRTGPLYYPLSWLSGAGIGLSPGFVWQEDGRVVGNVTFSRSRKIPGVWSIANVAVHPDFRRQGIATALLQTTIEQVQRLGGRLVSLQVRDDSPAISLYQRYGFKPLGAATRWRLDTRPRTREAITANLRTARRRDWPAVWQLFCSASPAAHGWPEPLQEKDFRPSVWRDLGHLLAGQTTHRWVAPSASGDGLDGYVELVALPRAASRLTVRARPAAAISLETTMLSYALGIRPEAEYLPVLIEHPAGDTPVDAWLQQAGFRPLRTLVLMHLSLSDTDHLPL